MRKITIQCLVQILMNNIIPGVEDSLLIFDGKIRHQLCNMPFELAVHPHNHRYSIVFDFNIDKIKTIDIFNYERYVFRKR